MAASPRWKVYRDGEYVAACKYPEDAAAIVANGGSVKLDHRYVVFEDHPKLNELAAESYDKAAELMRHNANKLGCRV